MLQVLQCKRSTCPALILDEPPPNVLNTTTTNTGRCRRLSLRPCHDTSAKLFAALALVFCPILRSRLWMRTRP